MNHRFLQTVAAAALFVATLLPQGSFAITHSTFYGIARHVAVNSIKVYNPKTKETLGFEVLPKFDQIFSYDGKTTYQMDHIKAGQYVAIVYDQKTLGVRHADKIILLDNANETISNQ
ncbi:MAG TPA: hypothetical protein VGZ00_03205 [Candidatus Baltobacteraceae bacterium]|jgi:hypothetical protein|nr:hypothetical protein [Candidatus Baltobacteraceae bacterium]